MTKERGQRVRRPWEPMQLRYVGHVADILQGGGGKISMTGGDPGEVRKEPPAGH